MSDFRVAVVGDPVPGLDGARMDPSAITAAEFLPEHDVWSVTAAGITAEYDVLALSGAALEVTVPRLDPRIDPPARVGPDDADAAYLWTLVDGVPNLVLISADPQRRELQLGTLRSWLQWMYAEVATRITSRPPVTVRWISRKRFIPTRPARDAVDMSNAHVRDEGVFAGAAVLRSGDYEASSRVRLAGHMEPLDGRYHWYGTVDDTEIGAVLKKKPRGSVTVSVDGGEDVPVLVTDKTVWGTYRLVGVGAPPFPL